ncbi:PREDICTED: MICOS complex subunit MIC60 [Erythranthe guttata]|uniref:MICOS complex subunit MIC60 n=1 Tax=Erythranthe guttata TaxID=4155 RepID=UPI00064DD933|nr:PREDICTED: MICOS complex subunit MIC60 [Erythranthe guttata]|eukprot:XP_012845176.1 PREDICTED: MICOS complex subunit MIC60 [Erythranthe guttata]
MLRRSILQLASRSTVSRVPLQTTTQTPSYLSSRRAFSSLQKNGPPKPDIGSTAPKTQNRFPKVLVGGLILTPFVVAAYYFEAIEKYLVKDQQSISEYTKAQISDTITQKSTEQQNSHNQASELSQPIADNSSKESDVSRFDANEVKQDFETHPIADNSSKESDVSSFDASHVKQDSETHPDLNVSDDLIRTEQDKSFQTKDTAVQTPENVDHVQGSDMANVSQSSVSSHDVTSKPDEEQNKVIEVAPNFTSAEKALAEVEIKSLPTEQTTTQDMQEVVQDDGTQTSSSLLDDYHLKDNSEESATSSSNIVKDISPAVEDVHDGYINKDGKLVLDFLQAIHAAEERQAELDAHFFAEEKRAMKDKYEKELKDARVRELMYAEREAILDKELSKERVKSAATLKSLQEKLEEKLYTELEQKEMEVEQKLKQMRDIAKAELAAAIASEKASQIEKMAEANLHIHALCMAFYARSEEARQSHSVHKLALGALSLEDALSKGLPIKKEIEALHAHLEGIDNDSFIALVLSSLPEETQKYGTDSVSQLNHKFDTLKGTLRHFSLLPPGGGGILSHSLAHVASLLKVKEVDESGDGIESLINRVENLLAQGKLCEAADTLEKGVKDSQAAEVVQEWVNRARNRAITEQALTVLQSYATLSA